MNATSHATLTTGTSGLVDTRIDTKLVLGALWVTMLMVFAYVDIFGFYRADVLRAALDGSISSTSFEVNQTFLVGTLAYILLPTMMIVLSLVLRARANRIVSIVVASLYALTIVASCIGETWIYYWVGSAVEVVLLAIIVVKAWTWPVADPTAAPRA